MSNDYIQIELDYTIHVASFHSPIWKAMATKVTPIVWSKTPFWS
jgi:hypothetical protein